jgi:phage protein U
MAIAGCYGTLVFECSRRKVHTFSDLKVENEARYATHDVHLQLPILEFTGPGLTEVTFNMNFNREWHSDPFVSMAILRTYCRQGFVAPLIVGNRPIILSFNLWVLTKVGEEHKWFMRDGTLFGASVEVSLKEYRVLL